MLDFMSQNHYSANINELSKFFEANAMAKRNAGNQLSSVKKAETTPSTKTNQYDNMAQKQSVCLNDSTN